jgi:hypothetical protein
MPSRSTSTPCRSAHQLRAAASAVKFAIVAPVVSTPPHVGGSRNRSRSHPTETDSSRAASGDASHAPAHWSIVAATHSAPIAAGVTPPITQWKKRGPAERTEAGTPSSSSSLRADSAPSPSSGSGPPNADSTDSAAGSRTGAASSVAR